MSSVLVPCPSCLRHVRMHEGACPFCGREVPRGLMPVPPATHRLSRRMLAVFATTLAVGCGSTSAPTYGVPPPDDTGDAKTDGIVDTWDSMPAPAYGMPADTGVFDTDTGSPAGAYGLPPDTGSG